MCYDPRLGAKGGSTNELGRATRGDCGVNIECVMKLDKEAEGLLDVPASQVSTVLAAKEGGEAPDLCTLKS